MKFANILISRLTLAFAFVKRVAHQATQALRITRLKAWEVAAVSFGLAFATSAFAQSGPSGLNSAVAGICKATSFVSEIVVYAVVGAAVTIYGCLYMMNAARDGVMETMTRVSLGAGAAISGLTIGAYVFGRNVC